MNDLVTSQNTDQSPAARTSFFSLDERGMAARAGQIANVLKDIIDKQQLSVKIGPNRYVKSEGWATLGAFLGILPRERNVKEVENGDYEAYVELVRQSDGAVVGGASALCSSDEKRWATADRYARRSMAITRATGKAYRLSFAWIMTMAGYQPTPYEEMPEEERIIKPVKPHAEGFDPNNQSHQDWLIAALKRRGTAENLWDGIALALKGRPATDLDRVMPGDN